MGGDEKMERASAYLVDKLFGKQLKTKEQTEVYVYGMTLFLTTALGMLSILALSAVFFGIADGVVFLLLFSCLRLYAGGYHCGTYAACFVVSNFVFVCVALATRAVLLLPPLAALCLDAALFLASCAYIVKYAPVLTAEHRLSQKKIQKNHRRAALSAAVISSTGMLCGLLFRSDAALHFCTLAAVTETSVSALMLILQFKERRNYHA